MIKYRYSKPLGGKNSGAIFLIYNLKFFKYGEMVANK